MNMETDGHNRIAFNNTMTGRDGRGRTVSKYCMTPELMEMVFQKKLPESHPTEEDVSNYQYPKHLYWKRP